VKKAIDDNTTMKGIQIEVPFGKIADMYDSYVLNINILGSDF